jgi:ribosome-binding protein aMBF1 (putative translation factor)
MSHQDWEPTVITSSKKVVSGTNTPVKVTTTAAATHSRKIDAATEPIKMKQLPIESRQAITATRAANKWTQIELNQRCGFPANTIRDIESGRLTPSSNQLSFLSRVLKIQLKLV